MTDASSGQPPELEALPCCAYCGVHYVGAHRCEAAAGEIAALRAEVERLTEERDGLLGFKVAVAEVHRRCDAASVPFAMGEPCNDPLCQTQAGHRVGVLIAQLAAATARTTAAAEAMRERVCALHCTDCREGFPRNEDEMHVHYKWGCGERPDIRACNAKKIRALPVDGGDALAERQEQARREGEG